ncbi:Sodium/hydrogen exchanger family-domain-containing protein [Biscogniauxia marginata]|nr:Sodium/hydrogen exchanger family-domain-containing protein [Biscogniauxia marginata]
MTAATASSPPSSLPYHEPSLVQILILSSFCLALNAVNSILDAILYCGLVGQVLIGTAWGTPGAGWLEDGALQDAVVRVGYLGLVLVVYEGGLSTSISTMKANLALSTCVALTGIAAPIALSFLLGPVAFGATPIQCFAAGAALCSTSLGTTFTVLKTSGLSPTRLGAVLTAAAMMDDVAGLVMLQIVASSLNGNGGAGITPATVLRPVLVSLAFAVGIPITCRYVLRPAMRFLDERGRSQKKDEGRVRSLLKTKQAALVTHTVLLVAFIAAASWAGASVLLAAYITGLLVTWWDSEKSTKRKQEPPASVRAAASESEGTTTPTTQQDQPNDKQNSIYDAACEPQLRSDTFSTDISISTPAVVTPGHQRSRFSGLHIYDMYYAQIVNRVLKPFFFASIGFSVPISKMFAGEVVWRGIVYSILMMIGKLVCGVWLVRFSTSIDDLRKASSSFMSIGYSKVLSRIRKHTPLMKMKYGRKHVSQVVASPSQPIEMSPSQTSDPTSSQQPLPVAPQYNTQKLPDKPLSLYPPVILASAMVARGEIGFLISAVAESSGIFRLPGESPSDTSQLFLVVTWAIVLCTIVGPLCMGVLVKRLKKLQKNRTPQRGARDVLGVWGVQ